MKKISKIQSMLLLAIGMFTIAASQITTRFIELPDMAKGVFVGIGFGFLILSLTFGVKSAQTK
jgi:hypothetical protein